MQPLSPYAVRVGVVPEKITTTPPWPMTICNLMSTMRKTKKEGVEKVAMTQYGR